MVGRKRLLSSLPLAQIVGQYTPDDRFERLLATSRAGLAGCLFMVVRLDPTEPREYAAAAATLISGYALYSLAVALFVWISDWPARGRVLTHAVDLIGIFALISLTGGPGSPFFGFLIFTLATSSFRWQWRGVLWTAVASLVAYVAVGVYAARAHGPGFELNRFLIRSVSLAVTAVLFGYLGAHDRRARTEMQWLAGAPQTPERDLQALLAATLAWAATTLGARRVLIAWEEADEPWLALGLWDGGLTISREPLESLGSLVAPALGGADFLCRTAGPRGGAVLYASPDGLRRWYGAPLHPALRARFAIDAVLSVRLSSAPLKGRLFFLDNPRMTSDDLALGAIVAHHVLARLGRFHLSQQLQEAALLQERDRVARDLHDGALHSLAGMALEIEALLRSPGAVSRDTHRRLRAIQQSLAQEQHNIRLLIRQLHGASPDPALLADADLGRRLEDLGWRLERQSGLSVKWAIDGLDAIPPSLTKDVYFIVHEALINIVRHACATTARVAVAVEGDRLSITVDDDGRGFPFTGRFDHETLRQFNVGPGSLRERVEGLQGRLTIISSLAGAQLAIAMPLDPSRP